MPRERRFGRGVRYLRFCLGYEVLYVGFKSKGTHVLGSTDIERRKSSRVLINISLRS